MVGVTYRLTRPSRSSPRSVCLSRGVAYESHLTPPAHLVGLRVAALDALLDRSEGSEAPTEARTSTGARWFEIVRSMPGSPNLGPIAGTATDPASRARHCQSNTVGGTVPERSARSTGSGWYQTMPADGPTICSLDLYLRGLRATA